MLRAFAATIRQTGGFTAEYLAVLAKADSLGYTKPSEATQEKDNEMMLGFIEDGNFANLEAFYQFKTDVGCDDFSKLNWKNPDAFEITLIGAPVFTANEGWQGGSGKALNTNYSQATDAVNASKTSFSFGTWILETQNGASALIEMGARTSSIRSYIFANLTSTRGCSGWIGSIGSLITSTPDTRPGLAALKRLGVERFVFKVDTQTQASNVAVSTADLTPTMYILALNDNGSVLTEIDRTSQSAFIGNGNINLITLEQRLNTRMA